MDHCPKCNERCCRCERGPRGPRGYQGPKGDQGHPDPKGNHGQQGLKGEQGHTGPKGSQGPPGPRGETGLQGTQGVPGTNGLNGQPGPKGDTGPPGPAGTLISSYGFAYTQSESFASGDIKFIISGPCQDVDLIREGLKVSKAGVYQISYKVLLNSNAITCSPSRFQIGINDAIKVASSLTESTTSTTLTSTELFSLLEGDVVKLVAELQERFSCKLATLQIIKVG